MEEDCKHRWRVVTLYRPGLRRIRVRCTRCGATKKEPCR
jgi:hypothetical protein